MENPMEKREQFTFYRSFYEALHTLPKKERLAAYEAVFSYALDGETQELSGAAQCVFLLIRPILDAARRNAKNARRRSKKSDEEIASETEANPERNAGEPEANAERTASETAAKNKKEIEKENENEIENEDEEKNKKKNAVASGEGDGKKAPVDGRADDADAVVRAYLQRVNPHATPGCLNELRGFAATVGEDCCLRAIDTALDEKHTAWSYIRAILRSKEAKGVRSLADWDADERRRERGGRQGSHPPQGAYQRHGEPLSPLARRAIQRALAEEDF